MKKNKRRALRLLLLTALPLFALLLLCLFRLRPLLRVGAEEEARLLAQRLTAEAAARCAEEGLLDYGALVDVHYDSQGRINALRTDSARLNLLNRAFSETLIALLEEEEFQSTSFPLGSLTGAGLFSAAGPRITVTLALRGAPQTELLSEFSEAGINQTLHTLSLQVELSLRVLTLSSQSSLKTVHTVPIAQTLLLGEVPQWSHPS